MHQSRGAILIRSVDVRTGLNEFPNLRVITIPDRRQQISRTGRKQYGVRQEQHQHYETTHLVLLKALLVDYPGGVMISR